MEEYWMSLLIFPIHFATYGLACAAVMQWNFSFRFPTLRRIWRRNKHRWNRLPDWVQILVYIVTFPISLLYLTFFTFGGYGWYLGFLHSEEIKLQLSGESYLGQNRVKKRDFDLHIWWRIWPLFHDIDDRHSLQQRAIKLWMSRHWQDDEAIHPRPFDEEYCESFVEEFKNLMGEESET